MAEGDMPILSHNLSHPSENPLLNSSLFLIRNQCLQIRRDIGHSWVKLHTNHTSSEDGQHLLALGPGGPLRLSRQAIGAWLLESSSLFHYIPCQFCREKFRSLLLVSNAASQRPHQRSRACKRTVCLALITLLSVDITQCHLY